MKKYVFCSVMFALLLLPTMSYAEDDFKDTAKKEMVEGCIAGIVQASGNRASVVYTQEYCNCIADKTFAGWSSADLKEVEKDVAKQEAFKKDMQKASTDKECVEAFMKAMKG